MVQDFSLRKAPLAAEEFFETMDPDQTSSARRNFGAGWVGLFVALLVVYRVVVGDGSWPEWVAGLVSVCLAMLTAWATAGKIAPIRITPRQVLAVLVRVPWHAVRDAVRVNAAVIAHLARFQPLSGRFQALPFRPGGDDPESAGRRVLVVVGGSIPANSLIVTIDRRREQLLVHQFLDTKTPPGGDREWPI